MTPEQLRSDAPEMYVDSAIVITTAGQLRAHADLIERYERLEKHAEAMADELDRTPWLHGRPNPAWAYRAAFPKEDK